MTAALLGLLEQYGRTVILHPTTGDAVQTRAFLRPYSGGSGDGWQKLPTPFGLEQMDRFLYLGRPSDGLEHLGEDGRVECDGVFYTVRRAQVIFGCGSHVRAELRLAPEDGEGTHDGT